MSRWVIAVEGVGKRYPLGRRQHYKTLRDILAGLPARLRRAAPRLRGPDSSAPGEVRPDHIWALRHVSFDVGEGEVAGVVGLNGSGKSTLLKILSRIVEPTEGGGRIRGRVGSLLEVGTGFHRELTGRENVLLNGAILGMKHHEVMRKFDQIVDFSEIEQFIDTPVKTYSSGMYVRLAFAVAAHLEPEVLLVDEVLAVGDVAFQAKCLGRIREVTQQGRTVLFVSHDLRAISGLTERCLLLEHGRLVADGPTEEVIQTYVASLNMDRERNGWANLAQAARTKTPHHVRARFESVRVLDAAGRTAGTVLASQPITIEMTFVAHQAVGAVQVGCVVDALGKGGRLFTVPSPEFAARIGPGRYSVRLRLAPNPLRKGQYLLGLRLFTDGVRQDTVDGAMQLSVEPFQSADDDPVYGQAWVSGPVRMAGEWSPISSVEPDEASLAARGQP